MRDYELELIASLAEGSLDDETEARALIESSPEHRAEYEAQLLAIESLRSVSSAAITDAERAALHRDVWTELRREPKSVARPAPWYYRWLPAAAALIVVVGVLSVVPRGEDAADGFSEISENLAEQPGSDEPGEAAGGDGGGQTIAPSAAPGDDDAAVTFMTEIQRLRDAGSSDFMAPTSEDAGKDETLASCVTTALSDEYTVLGTIPDPTAPERATGYSRPMTLIVAVPTESDLAEGPVALVDPDTCELVHLEE